MLKTIKCVMHVQSHRLNFDMLQEMQHLACSLKLLFEFNQHVKERQKTAFK